MKLKEAMHCICSLPFCDHPTGNWFIYVRSKLTIAERTVRIARNKLKITRKKFRILRNKVAIKPTFPFCELPLN